MTMTDVRRWVCSRLRGEHATRLKTISGVLWGGLRSFRTSLASIARAMKSGTSVRHRIKRVWRLVSNTGFRAEVVMEALAREAEANEGMLAVALDWVELRNKCRALVAGLCRKDGRALPVAWKVIWNSHPESSQNAVEDEFLERLAGYFTDPSRVVIVADRGFRRASLLKHLESLGLHYVIRICENVRVAGERYEGVLGQHHLREGGEEDLGWVQYREDGIVTTRVVSRWARGAAEPWYLATSGEKSLKRVCEIYAMRMEIEESFRDLKSHRYGAALRYVELSEPARYERLFAIWAMSMWLLIAQGMEAIRRNLHLGLSSASNSRCDLSVVRIGRETLKLPLGGPPALLRALAS